MDISFFGQGLLIGLAIAAPVGAIGLLCIRRTISDGQLVGFISGLGAATADACYGAIAAGGLTSVSTTLVSQQNTIKMIGGVFLCYLGWRTMHQEPGEGGVNASARGLVAIYGSTFVLTLANPTTILSFVGIFAGLGLSEANGFPTASTLVLGVFLGSALWWLFLSAMVGLLRGRLNTTWLRWVNRISGAALIAFGVIALADVMR